MIERWTTKHETKNLTTAKYTVYRDRMSSGQNKLSDKIGKGQNVKLGRVTYMFKKVSQEQVIIHQSNTTAKFNN
jgi:hypothetical protein